MSKSAALLLALTLGAGACSTTEPPQTIVAVVPAQERDAAVEEAPVDTGQETTDATESVPPTTELAETTQPVETTVEAETATTAPAETAPTTTPVIPPSAPGELTVGDLLSTAVSPDAQSMSARFSGGISMVGDVEGQVIDMTMEFAGAFDADNNAMEMSIDMSSMASMFGPELANDPDMEMFAEIFAEPMHMKSIGDTAWIKWGLLDMLTGAEGKWLEMEAGDADITATGGSPTDIIAMLGGADGSVTTVGNESIGGVETTHYMLTIDVAALAETLGAAEAEEFEALADDFGALPMDLWIDGDGMVRRLEMNIASDMFTGMLGTADSFSAKVWYEISDYGSDVVITAPPVEDVIAGDTLGLF